MWISIWARFREGEPEPPASRPDVHAWDYLGCLEVAVGTWEPAIADVDPAPTVPEYLMLHADTFDEWGREYPTFRATPLDPAPGRGSVPYRWFTRADTLWLVWSDAVGRGGIALREFGRMLSGRAGVIRRGGEAALDAEATAWPVNCYTRTREWSGRRRR